MRRHRRHAAGCAASGGLRKLSAQATRGQTTTSGRDRVAAEVTAAEESRARVEVQAFQAIYGIAGRVTVPETGETKRVQIDDMQLDPALTVRAVPKRDQKAYLYAKMTVGARHAVAAGSGFAVPRCHVRRQRPSAAAGARRGARAGLRHR